MSGGAPPPEARSGLGDPSAALRPMPLGAGWWVALTAGALIALAQLDRLIGQVRDDPLGLTFQVTPLTGPSLSGSALAQRETGWTFLFDPALPEARMGAWLTAYAVVDLVFIGLYGLLVLAWGRRFRPRAASRWSSLPMGVLWFGVAADVVESLLIILARGWSAAPAVLPWVSTTKWVALAVGAGSGLLWWSIVRVPAGGRSALSRVRSALYTHRLSLLVLVPLVVLGLPTGSDLMDQLPDIQRRWADPGGLGHLLWSGVLTVVTSGALFAVGRLRSHGVAMRADAGEPATGDPAPASVSPTGGAPRGVVPLPTVRPILWVWFAGPGLVLAGALTARVLGGQVGWGRLTIFCAVPLAIGVASACIRRRWRTFRRDGSGWVLAPGFTQPTPGVVRPIWRKTKPVVSPRQASTTTLVGDVLAGVLFIIPGLGLVRSFTGVVALGTGTAWDAALLVAGVLMLLGGWPVACLLQRATLDGKGETWLRAALTPGYPAPGGRWVAGVILAASCVLTVVLGVATEWIATRLGVLACLLLALTVLIGIVGALIVRLQDGGAPEVFWLPGIRVASAPVTTLLVLAAVLAALLGGGADVHGIRVLPQVPADPPRQSLAADFAAWVERPACDVQLGGLTVRPLLLIAAEGGGIRAAQWTAQAVDTLAGDARLPATGGRGQVSCTDVFMSSGASGGAVGLTVADTVPPTTAGTAVDAMAGPDALAAAMLGLVLTDTVYAATGVPLLTREAGAWRWLDRAGHMELVWEHAVPGLDSSFTAKPQESPAVGQAPGPAGRLVLNSTSSTTLCRTLIGQSIVARPPAAAGSTDPVADPTSSRPLECTLAWQPPASADLLDIAAQCGQYLARSTAALLAARFPFVTPSGVVCGRAADTRAEESRGVRTREQQIVDGGYLENTGVGTIVDLAPEWMPRLRAHNDCVLAALDTRGPQPAPGTPQAPESAATGCLDRTLVVPILVYLDNGTGSDLAAPQPARQLELVVPVVTGLRAKGALSSTDAQLRRAAAAFGVDQLWTASGPAADRAAEQVAAWRPHPVHVVYQATTPMVAAPLGWVLSRASMDTLTDALTVAKGGDDPCRMAPPVPALLQAKGYASFAELRCLLSLRGAHEP